MKVILLKDVKKLGKEGSTVDTSIGYAQNFLFPQKLAIPATKENILKVQKEKQERDAQEVRERREAGKIKQIIEGNELEFTLEEHMGKLVGSVTNTMISEKIEEVLKLSIEKKKIEIEKIHLSGSYVAKIHLGHNIVANLRVAVVKKEG